MSGTRQGKAPIGRAPYLGYGPSMPRREKEDKRKGGGDVYRAPALLPMSRKKRGSALFPEATPPSVMGKRKVLTRLIQMNTIHNVSSAHSTLHAPRSLRST